MIGIPIIAGDRYLIDELSNLIVKLLIAKSGTSNIYFINSQVAWTTYGNKKEYSKFNANVLISKSEQEYRIKANKFKQIDLKAL